MYIVIEIFPEHFPSIVIDENGNPILFEKIEDATAEADECQNGIVVNIN